MVGGLLAFFVLAQAGVPLTGGFVVKLEIFSSAVDAGEYGLATIGVLAAVVAAFFYLRISVALFTKPEGEEAAAPEAADEALEDRKVDSWTAIVLTVAVAAVLFAGILPGTWLTFAGDATFF